MYGDTPTREINMVVSAENRLLMSDKIYNTLSRNERKSY